MPPAIAPENLVLVGVVSHEEVAGFPIPPSVTEAWQFGQRVGRDADWGRSTP